MTTHTSNLPLQLTSLVGRNRELDALKQMLRADDARLVTLTGPGGSGKTRLALELATAIAEDFSGGSFLVSLAPITDPMLVLSAIAQALDVRDEGNIPLLASLRAFLSERRLLLVLDNFEQVLEAAPTVTDLLLTCPKLQVLVTSRAALHVRGEREFPVPPLALPDRRQDLHAEDLRRYAAIALFLDRAQAVNPEFSVDEGTIDDLAAICAHLDGLPLAIELAAARCKLLSPAAMLARLERRLPVLAEGARDLPERQRTLRRAISWSYDLLTPSEQQLFRCLSVFVGGCDLESAEAVIGSSFGDLLERIGSLVDKNLMRPVEGAGSRPRFAMLETIREFGLEVLVESGESDLIHERHAAHLLAFAEEAEPNIPEPTQEHWLQRLEREHDNLRAALRWYAEHSQAQSGLRLTAALFHFWQVRGNVGEGRAWLEGALAASGATEVADRAKALSSSGMLALYQSDFAVAHSRHEEALALHQAAADRWNMAVAINDLGTVALYQGDYTAAGELYNESLNIRLEVADRRGTAVSLTNLGLVAQAEGDIVRACGLHEQSLAIRRGLNDRPGIARALNRLGIAATEQRDYDAARAILSEALALAREQEDKQAIAWSLTNLGAVAIDQGAFDTKRVVFRSDGSGATAGAVDSGAFDTARALIDEGLSIRRELGDRAGMLRSLWYSAGLAEAQGNLTLARAQREEALAMTRTTGDKRGQVLWLADLGDLAVRHGEYVRARADYEESLAIRRQLGDESGVAVVLAKLAQVCHAEGDLTEARRLLEASVAGLRGLGDPQALAASITNLAQVTAAAGDGAVSEELYREAAELQHRSGSAAMVILCLRGLAALALARQETERAATLFGAVEAHQRQAGQPVAEEIEALRDLLQASYARAWEIGGGLSLDEAVAYAEGLLPAAGRENAIALPDGLSQREVDVLRLMAAGRSNPEIAAELVISVNTVYRHTSHIFAKTDTSNRVEAAVYAQHHGLL